jgi:hypothetical protein
VNGCIGVYIARGKRIDEISIGCKWEEKNEERGQNKRKRSSGQEEGGRMKRSNLAKRK